jgi:hypothetical protein
MNWTPTILKNDVFRRSLRTQVLNKRGGMIYTPFSCLWRGPTQSTMERIKRDPKQ